MAQDFPMLRKLEVAAPANGRVGDLSFQAIQQPLVLPSACTEPVQQLLSTYAGSGRDLCLTQWKFFMACYSLGKSLGGSLVHLDGTSAE